jgi:TPR repeat protein
MQIARLGSAMALSVLLALGAVNSLPVTASENAKICEGDQCEIEMQNLIKLARNGSGHAAAFVAMAYASGDGLEQDFEKAERFIELGARQRDPIASYVMSDWYRNGFVLEQDIEQADKLLARSVKKEYPPAMYQQALLYLKTDDEEKVSEALELLEKASETKLMSAMFLLARLKQTGTATEQDLEGAGSLFKALTLARHPQARDYLQQVIDEISKDEQKAELVADFANVDNIDVIQVRGEKIEANIMLDGLVRRLNDTGKYDNRAIGSRIRGRGCEDSGSPCSSIRVGNDGATSISELLSGSR